MILVLKELLKNDLLLNQIKNALENVGFESYVYYNPANGNVSTAHKDAHFFNPVVRFGNSKLTIQQIKDEIQDKINFEKNIID